MVESTFNAKIEEAVNKKVQLFDDSKGHYALRSIYAGMFLAMGTAAGAYASDIVNELLPGFGGIFNAFIFAFGLVFILFLGGELATSNMMYLPAGVYQGKIKISKAIQILLFCTLFNLVGAYLIGFLFAQSGAFADLTLDSAVVSTVESKLAKGSLQIFNEAILANIFVNTAILLFMLVKNDVAKIILVLAPIFMFVLLGFDHLIANFCSFAIVQFSNFSGEIGFTLLNVLRQWGITFLGNLVGGGVVLGIGYAWLNKTKTVYVD